MAAKHDSEATPTRRLGSSTSPSGSCRAAASTASATPTSPSELGITKASLHYHFAGKAELGEALIRRYADRFAEALEEIDARRRRRPRQARRLRRASTPTSCATKRMCLCGMLAADYDTLPKPMREAVVRFFDDNEAWLAGVLRAGRGGGIARLDGSAGDAAQAIVGGLEGALLIARPYGDVARFEAAATRLLTSLAGGALPGHRSPGAG